MYLAKEDGGASFMAEPEDRMMSVAEQGVSDIQCRSGRCSNGQGRVRRWEKTGVKQMWTQCMRRS